VPPLSAKVFKARVSSSEVTDIVLENCFHVATIDHDAPKIFEESLAFITRTTAGAT
jgi:carboxylesterase